MVPGIALVTRDHRDPGARMPLEPLAPGALVIVGRRAVHPEATLALRLERRGADVCRVGIGGPLEAGHLLDHQVLAVRDRGEAGGRDGQARAFHLGPVRADELVF